MQESSTLARSASSCAFRFLSAALRKKSLATSSSSSVSGGGGALVRHRPQRERQAVMSEASGLEEGGS